MFTIEHEFDATVITLMDEGRAPLQEDVTINAFGDCVTVEQFDPRTDQVQKLTLSMEQVRDLSAALNLPEGVYARAVAGRDDDTAPDADQGTHEGICRGHVRRPFSIMHHTASSRVLHSGHHHR